MRSLEDIDDEIDRVEVEICNFEEMLDDLHRERRAVEQQIVEEERDEV